jgi:hypothetical protein
MSKLLFGRSKAIAAPLFVAVLFGVACAHAGSQRMETAQPAHESTVTIAPGELYFVLPRRVCTSVKHVGDTVTAVVWRARPSVRAGIIGIAPDPSIPDSLRAVMRVVRVDLDSTDMSSPIQFAVERFSLGALRGSAATTNPSPDGGRVSRPSTRALISVERCFEQGRSLAGGLTDQLVLR